MNQQQIKEIISEIQWHLFWMRIGNAILWIFGQHISTMQEEKALHHAKRSLAFYRECQLSSSRHEMSLAMKLLEI